MVVTPVVTPDETMIGFMLADIDPVQAVADRLQRK
jgi:hypothetical protein